MSMFDWLGIGSGLGRGFINKAGYDSFIDIETKKEEKRVSIAKQEEMIKTSDADQIENKFIFGGLRLYHNKVMKELKESCEGKRMYEKGNAINGECSVIEDMKRLEGKS